MNDLSETFDTDMAPQPFILKHDGLYAEVGRGKHRHLSRLCGWLRVTALARNYADSAWSLVVEFRNIDGEMRTLVVPRDALLSSGKGVVATLVSAGLDLIDRRDAPQCLLDCLMAWTPDARMRLAELPGWQPDGQSFVLPDGRVLGEQPVILQGLHQPRSDAGTLEGWRDHVARLCIGNPMLLVAVSASLAGCILRPLGLKTGGLHFRGKSSRGKSTLLAAALGVWDDPARLTTWRTTDSALEGAAAQRNDRVLCLDELAEIDARHADLAIYMLANETGKARATRQSGNTPQVMWREMILSTGEISFAQKLAEAGRPLMKGQEVRMIDIAADRRTHGVFDRLHGAADGAAFSKELSQAVMEHHGMAGPALVKEILADKSAALDAFQTVFKHFKLEADTRFDGSAHGISGRGRDRFAAIAAAGEFAAAKGITDWPGGAAFAAALEVFVDWHASLGPDPETLTRHREEAAAEASVERLRIVLSSNRDRIADLDGSVDAYPDAPVAWHRRGCYFMSAQMWQQIYGNGYRDAARHCQARGFLIPGDGANILSKAPAGITGMSRAYRIRSDILP